MRTLVSIRGLAASIVMLAVCSACQVAVAVNNVWVGPNLGNWSVNGNWSIGAYPDACCDEVAVINNGTTAVINSPGFTANGLLLGQGAAETGGLRIENTGSLAVQPFTGGANGALTIGQAGQGNLTILGGGSLSGASLSLGGLAGSSIVLGDTTGLSASLSTTGAATLNRTTQITGRFVDFSAGGNLTLGSASTLVGVINHASLFSPLKSSGTASVNGTFKPQFSGTTPAAGNTWDIIDAATITGSFAALDTSAAPALPAGLSYQLKRTTGGTNGQLLQLTVAQLLTLQVSRTTGALSIANTAAAGTNAVTFDGYSILSSFGALTGSWNTLQSQLGMAGGWKAAPASSTDLSELNPLGSLTLTGGQSRTLGSPYVQVFPEFGIDPDHLEFEYSTPDGQIRTGVVQYSGTKVHNNLIVTVNPATGQAQLKNDSPYTVSIDGYEIFSPSGSLRPANGQWLSLDDQGVPGWDEATPTSFFLSELNPDDRLVLSPAQTFSLGTPFNTAGTQDLQFKFLIAGAAGDFNNDGIVDTADYVVWRKTGGSAAQYSDWRANFGSAGGGDSDEPFNGVVVYGAISGSGSALAGVPEPATLTLLLLAALTASGVIRSRYSRCRGSEINAARMSACPVRRQLPIVAAAIAACLLFSIDRAVAQEDLYFEDFEDTTLEPDTTTNFMTIAGGIATFDDASDTTRGRFVVRRGLTSTNPLFTAPVMTFSFDVPEPVTNTPGFDNELVFRAGIGTGNNTLSSSEFILEAVLFRTGSGGTTGGPRAPFVNNGNESLFVVANNQEGDLVFTSPVDGGAVTLNAFQYVRYVRNNDTDTFAQLEAISSFTDRNGTDPGPGDIIRWGIGSSSNGHRGTFALDNVRVVNQVSFGTPACLLGDTNCDETIDLENDFEAIRLNFRKSPRSRLQGDLTGDGVVNFADFVQWKAAYLGSGGSLEGLNLSFGATVPEPASALLAGLALLSFKCCRWRRSDG